MDIEKEKRWAQDAMCVQDACNLSGVVISWGKILSEMTAAGYDTAGKERHPVTILFASKVDSLVNRGQMDADFREAYRACFERAGK